MSDWQSSADDAHPSEYTPRGKAASGPPAEIFPVLRNWQVLDAADPTVAKALDEPWTDAENTRDGIEIEGEATLITRVAAVDYADGTPTAESTMASTTAIDANDEISTLTGAATLAPTTTIADHHDPAIVVTLRERQQQVVPGEEAHYTLTLLNNGQHKVRFQVTVEGWIDESWAATPIPQVQLAVGERHDVTVVIAPPRATQVHAGVRSLAIVVRDVAVPTRLTRVGATLTILPYTDLRLGRVQPETTTLSWWQKQGTVQLPITNRSNYSAMVRLQIRQKSRECATLMELPPDATNSNPKRAESDLTMVIPAGKTVRPVIHIRRRHHPLAGQNDQTATLQLVSTTVDSQEQPYQPWTRTTVLPIATKPLFGIWHLTSLVGLLVLTLAGLGGAGLIALLLFSMTMRPTVAMPQPVAQPMAAPPVIVAYIQAPVNSAPPGVQAESLHTGRESVSAIAPIITLADGSTVLQGATDALQAGAAAPAAFNEAPPILSPEQVSAPGMPVITASDTAALAVAPATPAPMTYATMFREIAHRYDLNWRMLAAQAYVESGFDSVALGSQGDLGLMQVLPATWREWAPKVDAADPFDSYSNVLVAATYLDYLHATLSKRGYPEIEWTLVAYNWGIDKVLQHLDNGHGWQDLDAVRQSYAVEILRLAETIPADG